MTNQMSLFNKVQFRIGDKVKVILNNTKENQSNYNYLKYSFPQCINCDGRIVGILDKILQVSCEGEMLKLSQDDVILLKK
ncbi:hypothetical protein BK128_21380 [Viridibacillus sp. FSL H7-0596]|uniref:hypothetical protein n=1 Tax=Viridibacillus sp. FSL H7-0596 TaxID=1928923 RepID=UPI00096D4547|nr:hypothetical protein [Viridibacillus sp. FSL H7-0596]OMC81825.1 hypothetical protein BK128_21380 [Viridibacillus sp. FSL H7-0596]